MRNGGMLTRSADSPIHQSATNVAWGPAFARLRELRGAGPPLRGACPPKRRRRGGGSSQTMSKSSFQLPVTSFQRDVAGSWRLETGSFQLNILQTVVLSFHSSGRSPGGATADASHAGLPRRSSQRERRRACTLPLPPSGGSTNELMVKPHG